MALSWLAACLLAGGVSSSEAGRVDEIVVRGTLLCGVWPHLPGFAIEHEGRYEGFDIDLCRAVATAILGDPHKVEFVPVATIQEFLGRRDLDLAIRRLTWTPSRELANDVVFGPVTFYDGQGFLVPRDAHISNLSQLAGQSVCVLNRERHPATLYGHFRERGQRVRLIPVEDDAAADEALGNHRCQAYSADVSWLAAYRATIPNGVARYQILPEQISKEPLAPMMRSADVDLLEIVRWTVYALIEAEELGLDSRNIDAAPGDSARLRSFLQVHPDAGVRGAPGWVQTLIGSIGNYGELYARNLGAGSAIALDRGLNRLWRDGGLMYAPPLDR